MITILYFLAVLWAGGTLGACIAMGMDRYVADTAIGKTIFFAIVLPVWCILGVGPIFLIKHETGPELAVLLRSDWECSASHNVTSTTYVQSGKIMVPMTSTHSVCDLYGRKQ
jgi:hypothetical protein